MNWWSFAFGFLACAVLFLLLAAFAVLRVRSKLYGALDYDWEQLTSVTAREDDRRAQ